MTACSGDDGSGSEPSDEYAYERPYYPDQDADGFAGNGTPLWSRETTPPPGYTSKLGDCDDGNAAVSPEATEVCNGYDDDCDASVDFFGAPPCLAAKVLKSSESLTCAELVDGRISCWGEPLLPKPIFIPGIRNPRLWALSANLFCAIQNDAVICFDPAHSLTSYVFAVDAGAIHFKPSTVRSMTPHWYGNEVLIHELRGHYIKLSVIDESGRLVRVSYDGHEELDFPHIPELKTVALSSDQEVCVLDAAGQVYCAEQFVGNREWGKTEQPNPVVALMAGGYLSTANALYSIGEYGALDTNAVAEIAGMAGVVEVAIGSDAACGRTESGSVGCWRGSVPWNSAASISSANGPICRLSDSGALTCGGSPVGIPSDPRGAERRVAGLELTSGACDNLLDARTLEGGTDALNLDELKECLPSCANVLVPTSCERACVASVSALSSACSACAVAYGKCHLSAGADPTACRAGFAQCAGFDF